MVTHKRVLANLRERFTNGARSSHREQAVGRRQTEILFSRYCHLPFDDVSMLEIGQPDGRELGFVQVVADATHVVQVLGRTA